MSKFNIGDIVKAKLVLDFGGSNDRYDEAELTGKIVAIKYELKFTGKEKKSDTGKLIRYECLWEKDIFINEDKLTKEE